MKMEDGGLQTCHARAPSPIASALRVSAVLQKRAKLGTWADGSQARDARRRRVRVGEDGELEAPLFLSFDTLFKRKFLLPRSALSPSRLEKLARVGGAYFAQNIFGANGDDGAHQGQSIFVRDG